jgi:hypothetical protein
MAVLWVVAQCSLVEDYRRFKGACCLHLQAVDGCSLGTSVGTHIHEYPQNPRWTQQQIVVFIRITSAYVQLRRYTQRWQPPISCANSIKKPSISTSVMRGRHSNFKFTLGHISVSCFNQEHFYFGKHYFKLIFLMFSIYIFYRCTQKID